MLNYGKIKQSCNLLHCYCVQVHLFINCLSDEDGQLLHECVCTLMKEFEAVTKRQLADFLPGGPYAEPATPEQWEAMKHCQLNNLLGEACLGDLDCSLFKRRSASVHHHTTINMFKRNKPITSYFLKKSKEKQKQIITFAWQKAAELQDMHREKELKVNKER